MIHPRAVTPLHIGGRVVPETVRIAVLGLFAAWMGVFGIATFVVALQEELTPPSAGHGGGDDPERCRPRPGTGRCHGELRDRQPPRPLRSYCLYAPREAGDLHSRGTLPRILER